jgi:nicotinamide-nucleotide amidase
VDAALIAAHGAVSEPVARAMAEGAVQRAGVQLAVAVTGIAGPAGGSPDKPVGTVWLAWAAQGEATRTQCCLFDGDRAQIRTQTCDTAIQGLIQCLSQGLTEVAA